MSRSCLRTIAARCVVAGVDVVELVDVVARRASTRAAQVGVVGDAEVVERAEQVALERVPQPQLGGDAAVEERADVGAVGAFGRRGEAEQLPRLEVVEEAPVGRGLGVVELVDDHDVEVRRSGCSSTP